MQPFDWINDYYGADVRKLKPTVFLEGKRFAVVRLQNEVKSQIFVGYVLVKKSGKHNVSEEKPLHDGYLTDTALTKMKLELTKADV